MGSQGEDEKAHYPVAGTRRPGQCGELKIVPPDPPSLLTLTGVSRRYGERLALCPVDLALAAGRCVAVMGANGSGKSTLLRIAAGRDTPTTGQVVYAGRALTQDDPVVRALVISGGLAAGLGIYAARRAGRLGSA